MCTGWHTAYRAHEAIATIYGGPYSPVDAIRGESPLFLEGPIYFNTTQYALAKGHSEGKVGSG